MEHKHFPNCVMKSNWKEITVNEFIQLEQLLKSDIPESYRTANIVALLSNKSLDEVEDLPISTFMSLSKNISFIQEQPKYNDVEKEYTINNRVYELHADVTQISTAQYIDYQNYSKEEEKDITKLLSCWLIPKGHKYNDGYDMKEVIDDAGDMLLQDAMGICFFFPKQLAASILILKDSLSKNLKKMEKTNPKITKERIKEVETLCHNMASSLWCLPYQRERTPHSKK